MRYQYLRVNRCSRRFNITQRSLGLYRLLMKYRCAVRESRLLFVPLNKRNGMWTEWRVTHMWSPIWHPRVVLGSVTVVVRPARNTLILVASSSGLQSFMYTRYTLRRNCGHGKVTIGWTIPMCFGIKTLESAWV